MKILLSAPAAVATAMIFLSACGPEPTTPASTDLGGEWRANAHMYGYSDIRMNLVQEPEGFVSGGWTARSDPGTNYCETSTVPCDEFGHIVGRNSVAQVEIELLGAGKFEGTLVQANTLRGVFVIQCCYDSVTFRRQPR